MLSADFPSALKILFPRRRSFPHPLFSSRFPPHVPPPPLLYSLTSIFATFNGSSAMSNCTHKADTIVFILAESKQNAPVHYFYPILCPIHAFSDITIFLTVLVGVPLALRLISSHSKCKLYSTRHPFTPNSGQSQNSRKIPNFILFSKSFTTNTTM